MRTYAYLPKRYDQSRVLIEPNMSNVRHFRLLESKELLAITESHVSPFEQIKRISEEEVEFWSSREFAEVLGYSDCDHFKKVVIEKAKLACFNSGQDVDDHFREDSGMVKIGSGAERSIKTVLMSRYVCYLKKIDGKSKDEQE